MKIQVFLVREELRDRAGVRYCFRERRLVRQRPEDKVLAEIEAPPGTWVRRQRDEHGREQLMVPARRSLWGRLWGERHRVPAKYVIGCARTGLHGLSLVAYFGDESNRGRPSGWRGSRRSRRNRADRRRRLW